MQIQMDGNIFSFLHFYVEGDDKNFIKKPCLYLHLSDDSRTEAGLNYLRSIFEVEPDIVEEESKSKDEILFYSFSNPQKIDKLIENLIESNWLIEEDVGKLRTFQQSLEIPGKLPRKVEIQAKESKEPPENSKSTISNNKEKKTQPIDPPKALAPSTLPPQSESPQTKIKKIILKENPHSDQDEHHNDDYDDDDNITIKTNKQKNSGAALQLNKPSLRTDVEPRNSELGKKLESNNQVIEIDHEKAIVQAISQGNLDLLKVLLGINAPRDEDYKEIGNFEIEILYRQHARLKPAFTLRLMNMLSASINQWQYNQPKQETVQQKIALLITMVREIEFNNHMGNFKKNKGAPIIEKDKVIKIDDIRLYEPWLRHLIDKEANSIYKDFLYILEVQNMGYVVSAIKSKQEEAQGAFIELQNKWEKIQEDYGYLEINIQNKIEEHQNFVDQLLTNPQLLPEAYQQNQLKQYNSILRLGVDDSDDWRPNLDELDVLEKARYKDKFIINVQNKCVAVCWINDQSLFNVLLTEQDSKAIIPLLPAIDEISTDQNLVNILALKCSFNQLKEDLYQIKVSPSLLIDGKSLLYYALIHKQYLIVKFLLLCGADSDLKLDTKKTVYEELKIDKAVLEEIRKENTNELLNQESAYQRDAQKHLNEYKMKLELREKSFFRFLDNEEVLKERKKHVDEYLASSARAKILHNDNIFYNTVVDINKKKYKTGILGGSDLHHILQDQSLKFKYKKNYGITLESLRDKLVANKELNQQLLDLEKNLKTRDDENKKLKDENEKLTLENQQISEKLEKATTEKQEVINKNEELNKKLEEQASYVNKVLEQNKELMNENKGLTQKFEVQMEKRMAEYQEQMQKMMQQMLQQQMHQFMAQQQPETQMPAPGM